jgi:hypothetical protein
MNEWRCTNWCFQRAMGTLLHKSSKQRQLQTDSDFGKLVDGKTIDSKVREQLLRFENNNRGSDWRPRHSQRESTVNSGKIESS